VDSAATFNAGRRFSSNPTKEAYEKGYAKTIGLTDTTTDGAITYKTGCSCNAFAKDVRRASLDVQYSSVVSVSSGVDTAVASRGVTDTSAFATAVATVIASDTTTYNSVTAPTANDITSVGSAIEATISGGTMAPTGASSGSSGGGDSSVGIIAGAAVGGVVLIVGVGVAVWWFNRGESTSADPKATTGVDPTTPNPLEKSEDISVMVTKSDPHPLSVIEMKSDPQPLSVETTTTTTTTYANATPGVDQV
jgi:hypothetical protein